MMHIIKYISMISKHNVWFEFLIPCYQLNKDDVTFSHRGSILTMLFLQNSLHNIWNDIVILIQNLTQSPG